MFNVVLCFEGRFIKRQGLNHFFLSSSILPVRFRANARVAAFVTASECSFCGCAKPTAVTLHCIVPRMIAVFVDTGTTALACQPRFN